MFSSIYTLGLSIFAIIYPSIDKFFYLKIYRSKKIKTFDKIFLLFVSFLLPLFLILNFTFIFFSYLGIID